LECHLEDCAAESRSWDQKPQKAVIFHISNVSTRLGCSSLNFSIILFGLGKMVGSENLRISLQDLISTVVVMVYGMFHVCGARAGCLQLFVCHCTTQTGCPACVRVKITVHSVLICILCACCLDLYQFFMLPLMCISCAHCCVICINCARCLDLYQLCILSLFVSVVHGTLYFYHLCTLLLICISCVCCQ
jgi:hypothetical protein